MSTYPGLSNALFKGVRVVELAQFVFVPAASAILADLGAEVIKIENVSGDPYRVLKIADGRQTKSANLAMELNNRGKKSVALDLKTKEGRELLLKLIETADVFLTSIRPDALKRLSLSLETLRERNPRLIYVHGNGLGFKGEEANRPGYDASCFWARGGFAQTLARPGQPPTQPRAALGDHAGAMNIAFGMASALFGRERTGEAATVEVSLLASAAWILSADLTVAAALSDAQLANVQREGNNALKRSYQTSDGRYLLLMFLDPERYWPGLCERIGRTDLLDDPRFVDLDQRLQHGDALIEQIAATFLTQNLAHWRSAFAGWDAPWEVCQTVREVTEDPQMQANGQLFTVKVADGTDITLVAGPVSFNGSPVPEQPLRAPQLGEHTDEVLKAIGVTQKYLDDYKKRNVIAG